MKVKQILAFSLLSMSSALFLSSCGDETDPAPTIDMIAENGSVTGDITMDGNKAFTLVFNVSDDSKVKSVEVNSSVDGRSTPQLDSTINAKTVKIKLNRTSLSRVAVEVWTITATDDKGNTSNKSITITTNTSASGNPLIAYTKDNNNLPFKVWNFHGPNAGAFDLLLGSSRVKNDDDADKDIHDSTGTAEIANWPGRWTSKNGTTFKKITNYAFADITNTGQLDAAWTAAANEVKFMTLANGDLYIAKLRGGNAKILIEVVSVTKTAGDNLDNVQFNFKRE